MARILVVDDEAPIRRLLREVLAAEGHEIIEAIHGDEALRLHQAMPADLVITDILMPEKDGLEVITQLRRESAHLKVIAISGGGKFHQMEVLQMAKPLGTFATLCKPFEINRMLEIVRRALAE
jgi:DNA-binding NtrC family response regulator